MTTSVPGMEAVKQRFLARSRETLAKLKDHAHEDVLSFEELHLIVHRLAGGAGMFGFKTLSLVAGALDQELSSCPEQKPEMAPLIAELEKAVGESR